MPSINVEQDALQAFRAAVFAKHGKLRGVLQEEASKAIKQAAAEME